MDSDEFRRYGKQMIDLVADFWESLDNRRSDKKTFVTNGCVVRKPLPNVSPGFIWEMIPSEPPEKPEAWASIFADVEKVVLQTNTNWHHPNFFAYYPTACSYPAIVGDILSSGIASIGFTWKSSPSMTELEMAMTDWLAQLVGLPSCFLNASAGPGAGIIQSTASDATLVALLSARARAIKKLKQASSRVDQISNLNIETGSNPLKTEFHNLFDNALNFPSSIKNRLSTLLAFASPITSYNNASAAAEKEKTNLQSFKSCFNPSSIFEVHDGTYFGKLVAYCSDQAHSSVDKGIMLCGVRIRKLATIRMSPLDNFDIDPATLEKAITEDRNQGLIPFIFIVTVGTTSTCAVESLDRLGPICMRESIWIHVDSAYAGSFLLCNEFRYLIRGIELVDSFNFNVHKAMMVNFDCSPMWFKDATEAISYFNVDPEYLKHEHQAVASDYRHLQVALGRRFRSLKIWFVLRALGADYIRDWLRRQVSLATQFAHLIERDERFELFVPPHLGLVCFRLVGKTNACNEQFLNAINNDSRIHLVAANVHGTYFLRLAICSQKTTVEDVQNAYQIIREISEHFL